MNCPTHDSTDNKMIVVDPDCTFIETGTVYELTRAAGVLRKVKEITERAMYGDLNLRQKTAERVKLLEGLPLETALNAVNQINLIPGAAELILYVKNKSYITALVSGGFSISVEMEGAALGIDFVVSNELPVENGCFTGIVFSPGILSYSEKYVSEELARLNRSWPKWCAVIGEGANDACIFEKAGFATSFNPSSVPEGVCGCDLNRKIQIHCPHS